MKSVENHVPFDEHDLAACQPVFDEVLREAGVSKDSDEARRVAAILVQLYRQGVRDPKQLREMVGSARGPL